MSAYFIARVKITDREKYREYLAVVPGIIKKYDGCVLSRTEESVTLEGPVESRSLSHRAAASRRTEASMPVPAAAEMSVRMPVHAAAVPVYVFVDQVNAYQEFIVSKDVA